MPKFVLLKCIIHAFKKNNGVQADAMLLRDTICNANYQRLESFITHLPVW
jgi:hypothetical protein